MEVFNLHYRSYQQWLMSHSRQPPEPSMSLECFRWLKMDSDLTSAPLGGKGLGLVGYRVGRTAVGYGLFEGG